MTKYTDVELISRADAFAEAAHAKPRPGHPEGQRRLYTNEPYIMHPREVAEIVAGAGLSSEAVAAALLHDTLEDTDATEAEIVREFGPRVAEIVVALTDEPPGPGKNRESRKANDLKRLGAADIETQTIKAADLITNTRSIATFDPGFAVRYLPEKRAVLGVLTKADPGVLAEAYAKLEAAEAEAALASL